MASRRQNLRAAGHLLVEMTAVGGLELRWNAREHPFLSSNVANPMS